MSFQPERSNGGVRPGWLKAVVGAVQAVGGRASVTRDALETRKVLEQFVGSLPDPNHPIERLLLNGLLLMCALRCGVALHAGLHRVGGRQCEFKPALLVERAWGGEGRDGRESFARWVRMFYGELSRTHPPSSAHQAAAVVRDRFSETWRVDILARRLRTTSARLRDEFRQEYGMSIHDYQRVVRTMRALDRVVDQKVEAVAYAVGYRSKKNFYRAFSTVTGLTVHSYRRLSPEQSRKVRDAVARLANRE
jgi:AraC-like DNA-binding protein